MHLKIRTKWIVGAFFFSTMDRTQPKNSCHLFQSLHLNRSSVGNTTVFNLSFRIDWKWLLNTFASCSAWLDRLRWGYYSNDLEESLLPLVEQKWFFSKALLVSCPKRMSHSSCEKTLWSYMKGIWAGVGLLAFFFSFTWLFHQKHKFSSELRNLSSGSL